MKNILIVQGHPDPESYCRALSDAYRIGAEQSGAKVTEIIISDLEFNVNLKYGYRKRTELEPDLIESWQKIKSADHLVFIYPLWWGGFPAIMKGFFDRLFLPGMAFEKIENSIWWKKLLKGRTARIITTMDQPTWYYWLVYWAPGHRALKKLICEFCGISPVSITSIGPIMLSSEKYRAQKISMINKLGQKLA
jgi:NAD(P)H dehydrogenase (quinone)